MFSYPIDLEPPIRILTAKLRHPFIAHTCVRKRITVSITAPAKMTLTINGAAHTMYTGETIDIAFTASELIGHYAAPRPNTLFARLHRFFNRDSTP